MVGPFGRWVVPSYRSIEDFSWDFAPLPQGESRANVLATIAWSMSSKSKHPEASWKLLKWLTGEQSQTAQSRLGLAIPTLKSVAQSEAFLNASMAPANDQGFLDAIDVARVPPWPVDPAFQDQFQRTLDVAARTGGSVDTQVDQLTSWWANRQQSPLAPTRSFPRMPWGMVALVFAGILASFLVWQWVSLTKSRSPSALTRQEERGLVHGVALGARICAVHAGANCAFFVAFGGPLEGHRHAGDGGVCWAGELSRDSWGRPHLFWQSLKVTVYYAVLSVPLGQGFALLAAVILNAKLRGVEAFRAAWYLPSVLAGVGMAVLWTWVFRSDGGLMNAMIEPVLSPLGSSLQTGSNLMRPGLELRRSPS